MVQNMLKLFYPQTLRRCFILTTKNAVFMRL
nr:MAG TPA: hypothetical protein [Caudoviricetes sp.]